MLLLPTQLEPPTTLPPDGLETLFNDPGTLMFKTRKKEPMPSTAT